MSILATLDTAAATERRNGRRLYSALALVWLAGVVYRITLAVGGSPLDKWLDVAMDLAVLTVVMGTGIGSAVLVRRRRLQRLQALGHLIERLEKSRAAAHGVRRAVDDIATGLYAVSSAAAILDRPPRGDRRQNRQAVEVLKQGLAATVLALRHVRDAAGLEEQLVSETSEDFQRFDRLFAPPADNDHVHPDEPKGVRFGSALIVEDEPLEAAATEMALLRLFERVVVADSLASARERLAWGRFDLAVIDLVLPDGDGRGLLPALSAHNADMAIVAVSTSADDETLVKAAFEGADLVLRQPLPVGELQAGVWQLYREGVLVALDHVESEHEPTVALN